ncbi:MAG: hypothetical protein GYB67_08940 [Chloroflexi bacterium]|nr:hypothetical protein [Chloroflexota bacterium]
MTDTARSAPALTLAAVSSGRRYPLNALGKWALLLFAGQGTQAIPERVNLAIRDHYPSTDQLLIANVADLRVVPRLFRGIAVSALERSYRRGAAQVPHGIPVDDYVIILPDWDGGATVALGFEQVDWTVGVALIDPAGGVAARFQSNDPTARLIELLAESLGPPDPPA